MRPGALGALFDQTQAWITPARFFKRHNLPEFEELITQDRCFLELK